MRELRMSGLVERNHIPDGRNAGHARPEIGSDMNVPALQAQAGFVGAEFRRYRTTAGRDEQVLGIQQDAGAVWRLCLDRHAARPGLRTRDAGPGHHFDALLLERPLQLGRDGFILERNNTRQQLDQRHVAAESSKDGPELDADRTRSHDHNRFGNLLESDRFVAGDDSLSIDIYARNTSRLRPGRDNDLLPRRDRLLLPVCDVDRPLTGEPPAALDPVDLVLLEQQLDAASQPFDDAVLARVHALHVNADGRVAEGKSPLLPLLSNLQRVRMFEERLGGNAAPVQTGTAQHGCALDDGGAQAKLRRPNRGDVTARARPNHYN